MLGALALGQAAWAGVTAYNDFGAPSLRNNSISRIGATLAELKASNGSVIKTGTLINFTSGQTSGINLKLTVTGSPLGQTEIGTEPPAETEAGMVFGNRVNCEGGTLLPAGKVHFIDLSGLDPAKRYELVLFASDAAGGEAKPVSFTLWDVSSFENRSDIAPDRVTISGQFNRTTTIETAGNDNAARGDVCRFASIRCGADGDLRVILQPPNGSQLKALMLREQTPPVLAGKPMIELGEDHAVIRASLADITGGPVQLRWRVANSDSAWQFVALTPDATGALSAQLDSLAVFVDHEFIFVQSTPQGEVTSEPRMIRPQKTGIIYSTGFEPTEPVAFLPGAITTKTGPWRVAKGRAEVQTNRVAHGGQAGLKLALTEVAQDLIAGLGFGRRAVPILLLVRALAHGANDALWHDPVGRVVGLLDLSSALGLAHGALHRAGDAVGIHNDPAFGVPRGAANGLDQ